MSSKWYFFHILINIAHTVSSKTFFNKKNKTKKQMHLVKNEGKQYLVTLWLFVMPMPIVMGYAHFPYLNTVTRVV